MDSEHENDDFSEEEEIGSDELLAADNLRLPEDANILVRLHALRAWLDRRLAESESEVGRAALALQQAMSANETTRPRRRFAQDETLVAHITTSLARSQQRQSAYEEARTLLEDCVAHTTAGDRLLVEYYLSLEELIQAADSPADSPWLAAMLDVLNRIEQVGTPGEGGE
jgi:hypothetical protein